MPPSCLPPAMHDFPRKKAKPIKIFSGVGHGVKKPKPKKPPKPPFQKKTPESTKQVREMMKEKFDFSRTPYALPARRRVALSEEGCKKRKFFKTTVEIETPQPPVPKKPKIDEPVIAFEFEDTNLIEEPEMKNVWNILDDWNDDDVTFQPQLTRQKAELNATTHLSLSYLAPSANQVHVSPNSLPSNDTGDDSNISDLTSVAKEQMNNSQNAVYSTPTRKVKEGSESPETKLAKMFSVFTTPKKNVLSDLTNKNTKSKSSLVKAAAPNDQLQIDAGQKTIGPVECSNCGMVYDVGDPVDEKRHADYHAKRHDLKYKKSKSEDVVGICGDDRIVRIRYSDEKKRDKVKRTLKATEEEIGCGYSWGPQSVAFLYIRNDRIVGCLIAERKLSANRVIRSDGIVLLSPETHAVKCGINRIWVKRDFRSNKIATEMMNCLRRNYLYGDYLKIDDIAFSATTSDGHVFAIKYTGRKDYLSYAEPSTQANA